MDLTVFKMFFNYFLFFYFIIVDSSIYIFFAGGTKYWTNLFLLCFIEVTFIVIHTNTYSVSAEVLGAKRFEISGLKKHLSHDTVVTDARLFFYASPRRVTMRVECGDMACDDDDAAACEDACSKSWSDDSISLTRLTTSCAVLNLDRWIEANVCENTP